MEKFVNSTYSQKEKAIKIGNSVPSGSVGLSWFSTKEISPANNIVQIDLSETILENRSLANSSDNEAFLAFADELGFLRTIDGKYSFSSDDITISNLFLNKATSTELIDTSSINMNEFVHYFYVSKNFIIAPAVFSFYSISQFDDPNNFKDLNIKVIDSNGVDYVDKNTGRKKYRFLLEPFKTNTNYLRTEIPYRIVVLLDADQPIGLKLSYDKVECDSLGNTFSVQLNYQEPINAVEYFQDVPEESFVIDGNYRDKRNFSIKKINQKYSDLISSTGTLNGYQIITPSKALDDNRNFEIFNWRLIARTVNRINLNELEEENLIQSFEKIVIKTIKVGVINDSDSNALTNPYIFNRLSNSPFNLAGYRFINPLQEPSLNGVTNQSVDKNLAAYWKVDINSIDNFNDFDVLFWCPSKKITQIQASKIKDFVRNNGTIIFDLSNDGDISELAISVSRTKTLTSSSYVELNIENVLIDPNKNGGWGLNDIYEKSNYGIFGSNTFSGSSLTKNFRCFEDYAEINSFIKVGSDESTAKSIGVILPYSSPDASELTRGNIIAVTFPVGQYCNAIFANDGSDIVFDSNISTQDKSPIVNTGIYPGVVEGPFKFLFNCIAYAAYCRLSATRHQSVNSAVFNYVSPWSSSWVLNQDVLTDSEKTSYFKDIPGLDNQLGVDLVQVDSLDTFYKSSLSEILPDFHKDKVYGIDTSNIEYFIEITNKDVSLSNAEKISRSDQTLNDTNIPSSYYLHKIIDNSIKPYAYTTSFSNPLLIPERLGAFALIDKPISVSQTKTLNDDLNIFSSFKSYPFKLSTKYSLASGFESNLYFDANVTLTCNMVFKGKYTRKSVVVTPPSNPITTPTYVNAQVNCENFSSAIDDNRQRVYSSANPLNTFLYSGDIDIHKDTRLWKSGMSHGYVKYIQYTVSCATGLRIKIDGIYGSQTANAVQTFQSSGKQRYIDGTVDSETKSYMAFWWKNVKKYYANLYTSYLSNAPAEAKQYIIAVENIGTVQDIGSKVYKKLTFSGFGGPNQAKDFIYFKIPNSVKKINKIIIEADSNPAWRNFVIDLYGYSATNQPDIFKTTNTATNKSAVSGTIEINMNGINADNARYMWFQVIGKSLKGYGYAEGFSIKSIKVDGQIEQTVITPGTPGSTVTTETVEDIWALATVNLSDQYLGVNISNPKSIEYSISSFPKENSIITSLAIGCDSAGRLNQGSPFDDGIPHYPTLTSNLSLDSNDYEIGGTEVKFENNNVSFDFTLPPISMSIVNATVTDVSQFSRPITPIPLSISFSGLNVSVTTSAVYYNSTVKIFGARDLSTNFRLKNLDNRLYPANTDSVDAIDGILLLCDSLGAPIGFPDRSDYDSLLAAATNSSASEFDARLGTYSIHNDFKDDGLIYGFYDVGRKEFLGKQLSHIDYLARGINNVFVAVCAIDADGNTNSRKDYIGPKTTTRFVPVRLPYKMLAPIYSVKMKNSSSIKMGSIDPNIYKFDVWELPVTNGSFWKTINISNNRPWADWKQKYSGQDLLAFYSTLDEFNTGWSQIYGYGFYDIKDEKPLLIDDRSIKLRRIPLMNVWYPTSNQESRAGIIKQNISVYTKEDLNSSWVQVSDYNIKEIDSESGLIKFKNAIVPNDSNLIKVSYTTKSKDNMIKQIDGNPIPLNPILNIDEIDFDEPLYIYLLPRIIYKNGNIPDINLYNNVYNRFEVTEYTNNSSVNFTYDSSMFDSNSSKYNPFALAIGIVYVTNNPYRQVPELFDIRVRGGGVVNTVSNTELQQSIPEVLSHWDVYPPSGEAYAKGGYVIIRIPESVKNHFIDSKEIYQIISNNLTAGVAYELQDMNGNSWN